MDQASTIKGTAQRDVSRKKGQSTRPLQGEQATLPNTNEGETHTSYGWNEEIQSRNEKHEK